MAGIAADAQRNQQYGHRCQHIREPGAIAGKRTHEWDRSCGRGGGSHSRNRLCQCFHRRKNLATQPIVCLLRILAHCPLRARSILLADSVEMNWRRMVHEPGVTEAISGERWCIISQTSPGGWTRHGLDWMSIP